MSSITLPKVAPCKACASAAGSSSPATQPSEWLSGLSRMPLLLRVIDERAIRYKDATHLWAWLDVPGRNDNLMCAVLVLNDALIVKTVMHH